MSEDAPRSSLGPPAAVPGKGPKRIIESAYNPSPEISPKRQRISTPSMATDAPFNAAVDHDDSGPGDPIALWTREGHWPREYFEPDLEQLLAGNRSLVSPRRRQSHSATSTTPGDQRPREEKSAPYRDSRYVTLLEIKGCFMNASDQGITEESQTTCIALLTSEQNIPTESPFRDDVFRQTCKLMEGRSNPKLLQDISSLIVPSAEVFAMHGATNLACLIESTNEGWNNSIPLTGARPQPDYSVGFQREAFTDEQRTKLSPFIGDFIAGDLSFFMATYYMYFPFLASEVKCTAEGLEVADIQNAHSMALAVRAVVELFRLLNRENELDRRILAFSISHDYQSVRIHGYYPVIRGRDTRYHRHLIRSYCFMELDGTEKWTAYRFTKNVYDIWMPDHFKLICSAIDQLPSDIDFDVPALSESTGFS